MAAYRPPALPPSEITPQGIWLDRRKLLAGAVAAGLLAPSLAAPRAARAASPQPLEAAKTAWDPGEPLTPQKDVTSYNNFYEFGSGKSDPAHYAGSFKPDPWTLEVGGLVSKPQSFDLDDLRKAFALEERVYRMRCVEAWSMVIPWIGFPISALLEKVEPLGSAKYVAFETIVRPEEMPGQRGAFQPLDWPYVEGLRLDEARHPLAILAVGVYGEVLPNQNGAPARLVVPWKYGFKGAKSLVKITLTEEAPPSTWNLLAPREYGFYANVNPAVDHPRWSQATERRIGAGGFFGSNRRDTLPFNGYAEEVASLYAGMDLRANY